MELGVFTAVARVQSLVRKLRSHKPCSTVKKRKKSEDLGREGESAAVNIQGRLKGRHYNSNGVLRKPTATEQSQGMRPETGPERRDRHAIARGETATMRT